MHAHAHTHTRKVHSLFHNSLNLLSFLRDSSCTLSNQDLNSTGLETPPPHFLKMKEREKTNSKFVILCSINVHWMFFAPAASARWPCFSGLFLLLSFRNGDIRGGMQSAEVRTVWKHSTTKKVEMRCGRNLSLLVFILVIFVTVTGVWSFG